MFCFISGNSILDRKSLFSKKKYPIRKQTIGLFDHVNVSKLRISVCFSMSHSELEAGIAGERQVNVAYMGYIIH